MFPSRCSGSWPIDPLILAHTRAAHLRQLADALSPLLDMAQVMEILLRPFTPLFPPAQGTVSLLNWDQGIVEQVRPVGEAQGAMTVVSGLRLNAEHPWCDVARSGRALFTSQGQELPALPSPAGNGAAPGAVFSLAVLPLPGRERAHGLLTLEFPGEHPFDDHERSFLLSLAGLGGQALDRAVLAVAQQQFRQELEERNLELRGYTSALSHNLGEPVQRVWNFLWLVERQLDDHIDPRTRRLFELARLEAEQITERGTELRALAVIERQAVQLTSLNLNTLLTQVRHDLTPLTRERRVEWRIGLIPPVRGDALLMWQVLIELLAFALEDAWEQALIMIQVEAQTLDGQVVVRLSSNGRGFPEELAERLFEVLDQSVSRKTALGRLGLSNVRRALGRQGGRVRAEGRLGEGVRFSVVLPRAEESLKTETSDRRAD